MGAEFKERGIGEMRVLKGKNAEKYRCVMRRDVVHKLCANFTLTDGTLHMSMCYELPLLCCRYHTGTDEDEQLCTHMDLH